MVAGPLVTPLVYVFFGTFDKNGPLRVLDGIAEAAAISVVLAWGVTKMRRPSKIQSIVLSIFLSFLFIDLITFLPKLSQMSAQDRMWLPVALLFYPITVSPTVIGICIGSTNLFRKDSPRDRLT
jgi:hypothetical protein